MTTTLKLYGTPQCRRYQRMLENTRQAITRLRGDFRIQEIQDTSQLSQHNPLDLPLLMLNGQVLASRNPPTAKEIIRRIQNYRNSEASKKV